LEKRVRGRESTYDFVCDPVGKCDQDLGRGRKDAYGAGSVFADGFEDLGHEFVHGSEIKSIFAR
jgi:hypothetical protein